MSEENEIGEEGQQEQQEPSATENRPLPSTFYNTTTLAGVGLALTTLAIIFLLFLVELFSTESHPYMGLVTFVGLPPFLVLGLVLAVVGIYRASRRRRKGLDERPLPRVDFNIPRHRRGFAIVLYSLVAFAALSAFGSYQAFQYTESVEFCGVVCHSVMKPEFTAYRASPHARVTCVQCHIGEGATWYVRSKLSGAYQVYSVLFNKYERPIPTPIANLRPAQETCEQCHWPSHFYSQKLREKVYFASDESNTPFTMSMLMKIGGGQEHGPAEGIHAHMYLDHEITYIALDKARMVIPYVEARDTQGNVIVYRNPEIPITDEQIRTLPRRKVDCIDCHNRPTHTFPHPARSVNEAMLYGWIDRDIPEIKLKAVEVLEGAYQSERQALAAIRNEIERYYKENYPEVAQSKAKQLENAIKQIQRIYSRSYFPEMKVTWKAFPDNLDHTYSLGCFRCHTDKHVSDSGRKITRDCNSCHTILSQQTENGKQEVSRAGLEFRHPVDIGDEWKTTLCRDCHNPPEE